MLLSPKEVQVLELLKKGYVNKDIAVAVGSSLSSVKGTLTSIYRKFNVTCDRELLARFIGRDAVYTAPPAEPKLHSQLVF